MRRYAEKCHGRGHICVKKRKFECFWKVGGDAWYLVERLGLVVLKEGDLRSLLKGVGHQI